MDEYKKDIKEMINKKTTDELIDLKNQVEETIFSSKNQDFKIDIEYWEVVLKKIKIALVSELFLF